MQRQTLPEKRNHLILYFFFTIYLSCFHYSLGIYMVRYFFSVPTKRINSSLLQQNLATPTIRMGNRKTLNIRTSTQALLTTSTKPPYNSVKTPNRTRHVSLSLNYSSKHYSPNTVNTEENLEHFTKRLSTSKTTRQISPTMKTKEKGIW